MSRRTAAYTTYPRQYGSLCAKALSVDGLSYMEGLIGEANVLAIFDEEVVALLYVGWDTLRERKRPSSAKEFFWWGKQQVRQLLFVRSPLSSDEEEG